jgi:4-hydroxybenzoate polyprenyltransferase
MLAGLALGAAILFYDFNHKGNAASPFFMGLCRVLAYVTAGHAAVAAPAAAVFVAALVCLSWLIGLTYVAKQEAFDRLEALWPLAFLAAPLLYGAYALIAGGAFVIALPLAAILAWILVALSFLKRRAKGDVPRAVVSLIAGISLVDTLFLTAANETVAALFALACFALTLALQRWISGT